MDVWKYTAICPLFIPWNSILDMPVATLEMKWIVNGIHIIITYSLPANASATVREISVKWLNTCYTMWFTVL